MKRVMIVGFSGSGKSTMASKIAEAIGVSATHLDAVHWLPNWTENTVENEIDTLRPVLERESWVIDGNYRKVLFKERMALADTVIFLDINRFQRLYRVFRRYFKYRGGSRPDIGEGCREKIDFEFVKWVLYKGVNRKRYMEILDDLKSAHPEKQIYILKGSGQVRDFMKKSRLS